MREFRDFIMRGNVIDLAVAVVIGGAFALVINSFVVDILTPLLGLLGLPDFTELIWTTPGGAIVAYGNFLNALIAFLLVALAIFLFVVLGLGVLISTVSQTTGQAIQAAFMILMPQILLSGMVFPLEAMAPGVRWIGYLLPLTYFTIVSRGIMLRGASIGSLWPSFLILTVMAVVVFSAATMRFRRELAPSGHQDDDATVGAS